MEDEIFGEIIHSYSRAEAIEDGYLVDITANHQDLLENAGIKFPVAMTIEAWDRYVHPLDGELPSCQDLKGRLWDVLWMLRNAIRRSSGGDTILFTFHCIVKLKTKWSKVPQLCRLKAVCGPGDDMEPVITIMLPEQD